MASYDEKSNTYLLSKLDKFRLFEIKHKSVEFISIFSTFMMPFLTSLFAIGELAIGLGLLYWWIGVLPDNTVCLSITTVVHWIIGIILGIIGEVSPLIWIIYFPLFINTIYYLVCDLLDEQEVKKGEASLEILYKQQKIK